MNNSKHLISQTLQPALASKKTFFRVSIIHYSLINALNCASKGILVPATGLEPVRCCHRGILSPLRLPISPRRHLKLEKTAKQRFYRTIGVIIKLSLLFVNRND